MTYITLHLTRAEALALDALVNQSAERLFAAEGGGAAYALEQWSMETAARACDKLRAAVTGEESPLSWSNFLQQLER